MQKKWLTHQARGPKGFINQVNKKYIGRKAFYVVWCCCFNCAQLLHLFVYHK